MSCSSVSYELIVAMNQDSIIGVTDSFGNQRIPWKNKEDMRHFRETTMGHILVMGRKTFESLPNGPLAGRIHIVLSRNPEEQKRRYTNAEKGNTLFFATIEQLDETIQSIRVLDKYYGECGKRVFVCGGEEIYRILLPRCERMYVTEIDHLIEFHPSETTSLFPSKKEWIEEFETISERDQLSSVVFKTYVRKMA